MLNTLDLGRSVSKDDYKKELPELRSRLLEAQRALLAACFPLRRPRLSCLAFRKKNLVLP